MDISTNDLRNSDYARKAALDAAERERDRQQSIWSRPMGQERWYLTQIGARSDDQALKKLRRSEFEYYQPMLQKLVPLSRSRLSKKQRGLPFQPHVPKLVPLFGKYLFMRFDARRSDWQQVFLDAGIYGIQVIADANHLLPAPISDAIVAAIKAREIGGVIPGELQIRKFAFDIGEIIRIDDPYSPWYGHEMPIDELLPSELLSKKELAAIDGEDGVRLAWSLFGRPTQILLPLSAISKR